MPTPLLISMLHPFPGAQQVRCELEGCNHLVYEHPENLERVHASGGIVICFACFATLKRMAPELTISQQMWRGELRKPEPIEEFRDLAEWLQRKG